jgi:hypothetical protein
MASDVPYGGPDGRAKIHIIKKGKIMPINIARTIRRTLTFILLTAASFWLFACQASTSTQMVQNINIQGSF